MLDIIPLVTVIFLFSLICLCNVFKSIESNNSDNIIIDTNNQNINTENNTNDYYDYSNNIIKIDIINSNNKDIILDNEKILNDELPSYSQIKF
jgi:hypothetical protein